MAVQSRSRKRQGRCCRLSDKKAQQEAQRQRYKLNDARFEKERADKRREENELSEKSMEGDYRRLGVRKTKRDRNSTSNCEDQ